MKWTFLDKRYDIRALGFLPDLISESDPRDVAEQLEDTYAHGGGWREQNRDGETYRFNPKTYRLRYRKHGGESLKPIAFTTLRAELIVFYEYAIIAVIDKFGALHVSRVD